MRRVANKSSSAKKSHVAFADFFQEKKRGGSLFLMLKSHIVIHFGKKKGEKAGLNATSYMGGKRSPIKYSDLYPVESVVFLIVLT